MTVNETRLVEEFLELVQIDSAPKDERRMADALLAKLKSLGLKAEEDDAGSKIGGNAGNVYAFLDGDPSLPPLLFSAHMDRVSPGYGIKPRVENGIIRSDGTTILAADDVAGVCAILEGIRTVKEQNIPHGRIEVVFTVAEEGGLFGAKNLDTSRLQAEAGFFLDSSGPVGTIIVQAPAQKSIRVKIHGRSAHAGVAPEEGINAIVVAAHAISSMRLGRIDPETTANIGVIRGGTATNIVPDLVELHGEARSRNEASLVAQTNHMVEAINAACEKHGARADIEVIDSYSAYHMKPDDYVVQLAGEAARHIGLEPVQQGTGGGSDANIINGRGIPSVVLGMGYENIHSTAESIPVDQLTKAAQLVAAIITLNKRV
jgi:tripeptide aminopeptidase